MFITRLHLIVLNVALLALVATGCRSSGGDEAASTTTQAAMRASVCQDAPGDTDASVANMDFERVSITQAVDGQVTIEYERPSGQPIDAIDGSVWTVSVIDDRDTERQLVMSAALVARADGNKALYWQQEMNELVAGGGSSRQVRTSTVEQSGNKLSAIFIPAYLEGFGKLTSWKAAAGNGKYEDDRCPVSGYQRY